MKYLSQEILDFTSNNITDDFSVWDSTKTYILETDDTNLTDDSVVRYGHYYYRSLVNDNLNFNPVDYENIKWVKWGVSNRYAMIDLASGTKSVLNDNIVIEFERNLIDTLTLGYFKASKIVVEHLENGTVLSDYTQTFTYSANDTVLDYWDYFYDVYSVSVDRALKVDIPYIGDTIKITLYTETTTNEAYIGYLVGGHSVDMGDTLYGVNFSFNSFAIKETDDFGTLNIIKRNVQDLVDFETIIDTGTLPELKREVKKIYNDIVVFIVDDSDNDVLENLLTLGVIENASIVLNDPVKSVMTWSIIESI